MDNNPYERTAEGHRRTKATGKTHIDVDRGIRQQTTPSGLKVCMYIDKPGDYWTIKGEHIPEAVARMAGFEVEELATEKAFLSDQAKLRAEMKARSVVKGLKVVEKRGPYELRQTPDGTCFIYKDDRLFDENGVSFGIAKELLDALAGAPVEEPLVLNLGGGDERA